MRASGLKQPGGRVLVASLMLSVWLVACNDSEQVAGIDGSGIQSFVEGPIDAFGSIVVNDVHYDLDNALILVNGRVATESELAIGQVVSIQATIDQNADALAESVEFEANLRGPVDVVDADSEVVFALGQKIRIGPTTRFGPGVAGGIGELNSGDSIEVSGLAGAEGVIAATYISQAEGAEGLRVIGFVDDIDFGAFTLVIGDLVVDYSGAESIDGFPGGGPAEGDRVLAEGDSTDAAGALIVNRLSLDADDPAERTGQQAEIEGLITRFVSPDDFDVSGNPSTTTAQTVYEGGTSEDLLLNVKVQVEGRFDDDGVIVATKIEIKDDGAVSRSQP